MTRRRSVRYVSDARAARGSRHRARQDDQEYLRTLEEHVASLDVLNELPPYSEVRARLRVGRVFLGGGNQRRSLRRTQLKEYERKLKTDEKLTFRAIFNDHVGFYFFKLVRARRRSLRRVAWCR
jgi:hypothetical protein